VKGDGEGDGSAVKETERDISKEKYARVNGVNSAVQNQGFMSSKERNRGKENAK
jgi:hypothetical protein